MSIQFPDPLTSADANGLVAIGYGLQPEVLLAAYRRGIFPWYAEGQLPLWWSPDPRMVLFPDEFYCATRLARRMRQARYRCTWNHNFSAIIHACAAPRHGNVETWILPEMIEAYKQLHTLGYAHSIEVWDNHRLIGGLYGVFIDQIFFAESMFSHARDGSKMALATLVERAKNEQWKVIDVQFHTDHLASLGAHEISRSDFIAMLTLPQ
ncbi:MAG: leucyl/phenylalanyl-tRNA--protein transferase [Zetaproteobacteria bacterium]|nr:leucyl/phenylalanyl-tRNA--protein transferase [Zetaproteobacteria bacterium]